MLINSKFLLAAAVSLGIACTALAAGAKPLHHHHPGSVPDNARANESYALVPPYRPGCTNVYYYDRALNGYSYDLVCNGVDLSPH